MKVKLQIADVQKKQALLQERTQGLASREMGIAMLFEGAHMLIARGLDDSTIHNFVQIANRQLRAGMAQSQGKKTIHQPTKADVEFINKTKWN